MEPRYRKAHLAILGVALLLHLAFHYATYYPPWRTAFGNLPYFRLHVLHEAEFLLIIFYAALVFRLKGGLTAVAITAITSIPFALTPYIFGRSPRPDELRDLVIQVVFILLMGVAISVLYEIVGRERERRLAFAQQVQEAHQLLLVRSRELEALNNLMQTRLNRLYEGLRQAADNEKRQLEELPPGVAKSRFSSFVARLSAILSPEQSR
ncbi:MAG: hypothetical protein HYU29_02250 [Chloroflexi bacterium]|nr:hypothetical protein [Chloroflexota bacterium]